MSDLIGGPALDPETLEERLEEFLFAAPSHRSATRIANGLCGLPREDQEFALRWAEIVAQSYTELGYQVAMLAPRMLQSLGHEGSEALILAALERFDQSGSRAAMDLLRDFDGFRIRRERGEAVARLEAVETRLERLLQGLSGRRLRVEEANDGCSWTDTEALYLPAAIAEAATYADNLAHYRVRCALLWGQTRFGTFNGDGAAAVAGWQQRERALQWFAALEAIRLEAAIGRELPGLAREIAAIRGPWPASLARVASELADEQATLADTLRCLESLRAAGEAAAPPLPHAGSIDFDAALRVRAARIERETEVLRRALGQREGRHAASVPPRPTGEPGEALPFAVMVAGEMTALPPEAAAAARSLMQDLGEIPPELLSPAGDGIWSPTAARESTAQSGHGTRAPDFSYDEWDYRRNAYRSNWCHLFEHAVGEGDADFAPRVRERRRAHIAQLRRRFEMLRGEDRMLRRQDDGEEIDLDALIAARADRRAGTPASPKLYCRRARNDRSLSVMLMIDMSGSTKGWINDAEREALVMLGEAIEALGDSWAVYGFSGWTRTRCDIYRVKAFADAYDESVQRRIAAIEPKDYTRMGVAIRHLSRELVRQPTRHHLLITLSDGKPDDFSDEYRSRYGIEDTRRALLEARALGIRSYCVTIDRNGADYLRHLYGPARYTVLDDVTKLPLKIADIYRRLVT
jgi:nitric oxide reductase NorD protein